ncbi:ankyrin repeat domain 34Bb [Brachyhypopomus gauderio]|uniref:ankyrin repeat domain 34Bb n=1 Tax=Brachyhypopomus gauderio TaxID=698409 RepID=UPI00404332B1
MCRLLNCIVAVCPDMGIGKNGNLPWHPIRLSKEFKHFQRMTMTPTTEGKRNVVIMGRKTWFSIPAQNRPLKNRINIVLSRELKAPPEGAHYLASDFSSALRLLDTPEIAEQADQVWVIGGSSIYKEAMESPGHKRLFVTRILTQFDCDTFIPNIDLDKYKLLPEFSGVPAGTQEENGLPYVFEVYESTDHAVMEDSVEVRTDGNSLLKAVHLCRLRLTRLLLEGGAYINESNERGETPLMVACKTRHTDTQSVPKSKMVRYLLENGADPNIQDKSGKTALMHACVERAGEEVLSQLLSSGADPSLEDHSGSSALVYAVNAGDKKALRVLLDACKAKGKEVIIITTDKLPSGRQMTKQYLNIPPSPDLEDRLHCGPTACMSPSEIQLCAPHLSPRPSQLETTLGNQRENQAKGQTSETGTNVCAKPASPTQDPSAVRAVGVAKLLHLQRLHSEPWLKIPPSVLLQQSKASSLTEELLDITPEEELSFGFSCHQSPLQRVPLVTRHESIDAKDAAGLLRALERVAEAESKQTREAKRLSRKMSYDGVSLPHSTSHQNLLKAASVTETVPVDEDPYRLPDLAVSSLRNVVLRRNTGVDHYGSDSQLPQFGSQRSDNSGRVGVGGGGAGMTEKCKLMSCRSSTLSGSKESLENVAQRRSPALVERRGSAALLLDHIAQTRPGYLPPLNPHAPIPDIKASTSTRPTSGTKSGPAHGAGPGNLPLASGPRHFVPCAPSVPRDLKAKKTLLRRHSMQTEQIKHLVNCEELLGQ